MNYIDFSWFKPTASAIRQAGFGGLCGYVSHDTSGKNLSTALVSEYRAADLEVIVNFEDTATNALGGYSQGLADGRFALAQAKALGYPMGCAIYFSVDFDASQAQMSTILTYFRGCRDGLNGYYRLGGYGGYYVIEALQAAGLCDAYWQALAWSGGQVRPGLALYQNGASAFNGNADVDELRGAPTYGWKSAAPTPQPASKSGMEVIILE